jgi:hypothetical protein
MECNLCFNENCVCLATFTDFSLYPFSTASVEVKFETNFCNNFSSRFHIFHMFEKVKRITSVDFPQFEFSEKANRRRSAECSNENVEDSMYNSCLIRKQFTNPTTKKVFNTSCLLFRGSLILTLGNYEMRETVFKDYMRIIRSTFMKFTTFKILSVKTVLANCNFKGNKGPQFTIPNPSPSSSSSSSSNKRKTRIPAKFVKLKEPNFNLSATFLILKPLFSTETRKIIFNPIINDSNVLKILLFTTEGKKNGTISIFSSGK